MEARIEAATERGLQALWAVVAEEFPEATAGDIAPEVEHALETTAKAAIRHWCDNNC